MTTSDEYSAHDQRRRQALLDGDSQALAELVDPTCVFVHGSGLVESGESYVQRMATNGSPYLDLTAAQEAVTVFQETAIVTYRQSARMRFPDGIRDNTTVCTAVWQTSGGRSPQLIGFHNAHVPEQGN